MIYENKLTFTLNTANTTYIFRVDETNHLEHLYYGRNIGLSENLSVMYDKHSIAKGNMVSYSEEHPTYTLDNIALEYSSSGKGDYREPSIIVRDEEGSICGDFLYAEHRIIKGKPRSFSGLPESYSDEGTAMTLIVVTVDPTTLLKVEHSYTTFDATDVIVRKAALINNSTKNVTIERFMSLHLDLNKKNQDLTTFDGAWARERFQHKRRITPGVHINDSKSGVSSSKHNPFIMISDSKSDEMQGECYGFNLIYSGDHSEIVELNQFNKIRILSGINPSTFRWKLKAGEKFHTPEAIMTFSHEGTNGISNHFHRFINNHIVRGKWQYHQRPIAFNNWEATYFNYDETTLVSLAKEASSLGIELFVVDDGWFGVREDDTTSLGDWMVNTKKFPNGLTSLSKKLHSLGLMFGLWVEPEMISKKSTLYETHPDYLVQIPGRNPSIARNQYLLDLTRKDVRDYLFDMLSKTWKIAEVDYVKWDMNRTFSDLYSNQERFYQGEFSHRYVLGLYELLERCVKAFPHILFESCASGGNRFDLGMLSYMSQTWTSDNTDAYTRIFIQEGTACGYPLSAISNHVSTIPNHQTLRKTSLDTRFNVASFGVLGYELDLLSLSKKEKEEIIEHITFYKQYRTLFQFGEFFKLESIYDQTNRVLWAVSNYDRTEMLVLYFQVLQDANGESDILRIPIADTSLTYRVSPRSQHIELSMFGSLINMVSPVHIKSGGNLEKVVQSQIQLDSEIEYYIVEGDILAYRGISLNQQFGGTGYDKETRVLGDFGSRLYYIQAMK
ncbi:MAG: alpha-galactosidase [Spirochaetia bacterium]|nr:alpha-galactosidase [Spirochaetia bacterium]